MKEPSNPVAHPLDVIRTERSAVTDALPVHKRVLLLQGLQMGVLEVVYDIIEGTCIKQETKMLNLEPHQREQIYAEYRMSKAFWQVFVELQKRVQLEIKEHLGTEVIPELPDDVRAVNELLDPTTITN